MNPNLNSWVGNGQAIQALDPPPLELNGHRNFFLRLQIAENRFRLITIGIPLKNSVFCLHPSPPPLNGLAIVGGTYFSASHNVVMLFF